MIYSTLDRNSNALNQIEESFEERRLRMPKIQGVDASERIPDLGRSLSRTSSIQTVSK